MSVSTKEAIRQACSELRLRKRPTLRLVEDAGALVKRSYPILTISPSPSCRNRILDQDADATIGVPCRDYERH